MSASAGGARIRLHALVPEHRSARDDAQAGKLRQTVDDALGQAVAEVLEIVAPRALEGEHRDRLAARHSTLGGGGGAGSREERPEREGGVPRAAEPALRRLREAVFDDAPELRRSGRIERRQPRRGVAQRGGHDFLRRPARERTPGGQHLVQDAAEREQIAAGIGRQPLDLFGRHVPDRPEHDAGNRAEKRRGIFFGVRDDGRPPREAEVEDLGPLSDRAGRCFPA